jgi:uncharacterized protein YbjT (DUF2867 family)
MTTKPIFVAGATGNIGRELVGRLVQRRARVRAGVRSQRSADALKQLGAEPFVVDLGDVKSVTAALAGVERAFSLSPLVPNQAELGVKFVEAAVRAGVEYVVRASSFGAGSPDIVLNAWHREAELALEDSGIPYTLVRPTFFMQNYLAFGAGTITSEDAFYLPHGDGAISSIDVGDIAAVAATVLTEDGHAGRAYELTGPEPLTGHDIAAILSRATGRTIEYVDVPVAAARRSLTALGMPAAVVEGLLELAAVIRADRRAVVTSAVAQVTGIRPRSFERFVADHLDRFVPDSGTRAA